MGVYSISQHMLGAVLGMADESAHFDETAIGSINVRLEQMFREEIIKSERLVFIYDTELTKLVDLGGDWRKGAKQFATLRHDVDRKEGVPDNVLAAISHSTRELAQAARDLGKIVFCSSPVLRYSGTGRKHALWVEMKAVAVDT